MAGVTPRFVACPADVAEAAAVLRAAAAERPGRRCRAGPGPGSAGAARRPLRPGDRHPAAEPGARARRRRPGGPGPGRGRAGPARRGAGRGRASGSRSTPRPLPGQRRRRAGAGTVGGILAAAWPARCGCATARRATWPSGSPWSGRTGPWPPPAARWSRTWPATTSASCSPGSYGTLGLIVEAAFRLHPLPAATAFVTLDGRGHGRRAGRGRGGGRVAAGAVGGRDRPAGSRRRRSGSASCWRATRTEWPNGPGG